MKRPGLIRGILLIGIVYVVSGIIHRLNMYNCAHASVRVVINTDGLVADELCAIETLLTALHEQEGHTLGECITHVQAQFPYLHDGAAVFEPGSIALYSFACSKPVCIVNDTSLLLDDGVVVGNTIFDAHAYADLPAISMDQGLLQDEHQTRRVADAMARIDPAIAADNAIHWHTIHSGFIGARPQAVFKVMFDVTHIPTAYILSHCTTIHHELQDSNTVSQGIWIADIRFNNQIIVYRGKGGGYG